MILASSRHFVFGRFIVAITDDAGRDVLVPRNAIVHERAVLAEARRSPRATRLRQGHTYVVAFDDQSSIDSSYVIEMMRGLDKGEARRLAESAVDSAH